MSVESVFFQAANLRKKAARVEEDNDSLALQLKKMATKAKSMFDKWEVVASLFPFGHFVTKENGFSAKFKIFTLGNFSRFKNYFQISFFNFFFFLGLVASAAIFLNLTFINGFDLLLFFFCVK